MKRISPKPLICVAAILGFALVSVSQSAWAQSNCKEIKGHALQSSVTGAGDLDGTMTSVFFGPPFPTNDPNTFSFTNNTTITTHLGDLKAPFVTLYDFTTGVLTSQGRIDSAASTGIFAGATGFIFVSGTVTRSSPFTVDLSGKICYAR